MASSQTESSEGDKAATFPAENSSLPEKSFVKPTLRPIATCSSPSSSSSCSSASSSPCSIFGASKAAENGIKTANISDETETETESDVRCSSEEICTTPKAKEFRIPEILVCPPAPRKRRVRSRFHSVPLTGFLVVPTDLDSMFSIHKIPVNM